MATGDLFKQDNIMPIDYSSEPSRTTAERFLRWCSENKSSGAFCWL